MRQTTRDKLTEILQKSIFRRDLRAFNEHNYVLF